MKKLLASIALSLGLLYPNNSKADIDDYHRMMDGENDQNERALVLAANTAFGALTGCIGAEISGDGCREGAWRGAIGGALAYAGMELGSYNAEIPFTGLAGRLVTDLGGSIITNAATSRDFLGRYETTLGPLLFRFDNVEGFHTFLMPGSIGGIVYNIVSGHDIDLVASLEDGTVVFSLDSVLSYPGAGSVWGGNSVSNIPSSMEGFNFLRSHENIHTYQLARLRLLDDLMPDIWVFKYGAELGQALITMPSIAGKDVYENNPAELEAYALERGWMEWRRRRHELGL